MYRRFPLHLGVVLGALYGLALWWLFELVFRAYGLGLVSVSFFFLVPFLIGFLRIALELRQTQLTPTQIFFLPWQPIFVFLAVSFLTLMEGAICILVALPGFLLLASLGGLLAEFNHRLRLERRWTLCLVALPLITAPIEGQLPRSEAFYEIRNTIVIEAAAERVWQELGNVSYIDEEELPLSLTRLMGIPRPLEARMDGASVGSVRTSVWDKGVEFQEVITRWEPGVVMAYDFLIDPQRIPDDALDRHVKLGGEYFSPLRGKYELREIAANRTELSLSTVVRDNTRFGLYSRVWVQLIFSDFHDSLLQLMKERSENLRAIALAGD